MWKVAEPTPEKLGGHPKQDDGNNDACGAGEHHPFYNCGDEAASGSPQAPKRHCSSKRLLYVFRGKKTGLAVAITDDRSEGSRATVTGVAGGAICLNGGSRPVSRLFTLLSFSAELQRTARAGGSHILTAGQSDSAAASEGGPVNPPMTVKNIIA